MPRAIFIEEQLWYYLTYSLVDKGVRTFSKSIFPKVNITARLTLELAHSDTVVPPFNQFPTGTPHLTVSQRRNNIE